MYQASSEHVFASLSITIGHSRSPYGLPRRENHDFFSGSGSSYVIGKAVNTEDEDWEF